MNTVILLLDSVFWST